jgi:hypothetical protein
MIFVFLLEYKIIKKILTLLLYIKNNFYSLCLFNLNMNGKIFEIDI